MLSRKSVYPYEFMDKWEKFRETSFPEKEEFYSNLNMEDVEYMHVESVFKNLKSKILVNTMICILKLIISFG